MKVDAVIVAAGSASRFGSDKLFADLEGRPVLAWSVAAFEEYSNLGCMVVVAAADQTSTVRELTHEWAAKSCVRVVAGGARRRDSVQAGLEQCNSRYVAIHDGARPLVTPSLIERVVAGASGGAAALAAVPVTDTIKEGSGGIVVGHPERSRLWAAQTPQVVLRQAWLDAAATSDNDETDDAAMLARFGLNCALVEGDPDNIKITRPLDLELARLILRSRGRP